MTNFKIIDTNTFGNKNNINQHSSLLNFKESLESNTTYLFWQPNELIGSPIFLEYSYNQDGKEKINTISNHLKNINSKIYFLYGGFDNEYYNNLNKLSNSTIEIIYWPTYLLHECKFIIDLCSGNKIDEIYINKEFINLFVCQNANPRTHRAMMIDNLFKNELFGYGKISWLRQPNVSLDYNFKYWSEVTMTIEDNFINPNRDYNNPFNHKTPIYLGFLSPEKNYKSLINLVTETFTEEYFITEKTYKNLFIEQIFISLGKRGFNKKITELGFVLFDEIFDYEFDDSYILVDRINGIIKNLINLKNQDYYKIYEQVKDKLKHNKKRALEISNKDPFVPTELKVLYQNNKEVFIKYLNLQEMTLKYPTNLIYNFL